MTRLPTIGAALTVGPDQSALRGLVRTLEPIGFAYAPLAAADEREVRWRTLSAALRAQGAPTQTITEMASHLADAPAAPASLAIFASRSGAVLHEGRIPPVDERAGYAAPPMLVSLLAAEQQRPPHLVVVVDRAGADVTVSEGGTNPARTISVVGPDDEIERNAPGRLAQPRFQRRAEDSWRHNAARVAEIVHKQALAVGAQALVLSGDVRATQLLSERLNGYASLIVRHINGSRAPDGSQSKRAELVDQELRAAAEEQTRAVLEQFQAHLEPGGLAVEGAAATINALAAGRAAMLLVTDATSADVAWFGEAPTEIYRDEQAASLGGLPIGHGPLVDVAVRSALLSDVRVRVVPADADGAPSEGIGALCRYPEPRTQTAANAP